LPNSTRRRNRRDLPLGRPQPAGGELLGDRGFTSVHNLAGGILAWSREVDPSIPQY
jgi:rhodanese-related sulfurtransferase